jgi:TolA-binding protein
MSIKNLTDAVRNGNETLVNIKTDIRTISESLNARKILDEQSKLDDLEAKKESQTAAAASGKSAPSAGPARADKADKKPGMMGAALAGGLGIAAKGAGMAAGLGALGFGIGAFFTGLSLGDTAQAMIGADMQSTKKNMITLGEAFAETPTDGLIKMGVAAAIGAKFGSLAGAARMTFFGAGLGGFFAGLALGDKGAELLKISGTGLTTMMVSFATGLNAFDDKSMIALGAIVALAASPLAVVAAAGLPVLGVGLAGFFGAIAGIGDILAKAGVTGEGMSTMMINLAAGLNPLSSLDGSNMLVVGDGMKSIAGGMLALFGSSGLSSIMDMIGSLFSRGDEDVFSKTARSLKKLEGIDASKFSGIEEVSTTISNLTSSIEGLNDIEVDQDNINEQMENFAKSIAGSINLFDAMWKGGKFGEGWFDGISEMDFGVGLKGLPMEEIGNKISAISSAPKVSATDISEATGGQKSQDIQKSTPNNSSQTLNETQKEQSKTAMAMTAMAVDSSTKVNNINNSSNIHNSGGSLLVADMFDPMMGTRT